MVVCLCCIQAIPSVSVQLLATAAALVYGHRTLFRNRTQSVWLRRVTFAVTIIFALALGLLAVGLLVLSFNDDLRLSAFASFCAKSGSEPSPLDEHRCALFDSSLGSKVIEFGTGPGTNFRCLENITQSIEKYVAVEPNSYFVDSLNAEFNRSRLDFELDIVGTRGEDIDIADNGSYDSVIMTHVLCSVKSVETVLDNAEKALRPGGKMLFMEHVLAKDNTRLFYLQRLVAPILYIVGNGCKIRNLEDIIRTHFGERMDIDLTSFDGDMPKAMFFARPHIKGVAVKK
mmetsp:Transcript_29788/g.70819  ORF Transcript_29788/g.70819 Transcript_29788/m.70819 type:complete len:287 (-) Transcript_29788:60-920(-)